MRGANSGSQKTSFSALVQAVQPSTCLLWSLVREVSPRPLATPAVVTATVTVSSRRVSDASRIACSLPACCCPCRVPCSPGSWPRTARRGVEARTRARSRILGCTVCGTMAQAATGPGWGASTRDCHDERGGGQVGGPHPIVNPLPLAPLPATHGGIGRLNGGLKRLVQGLISDGTRAGRGRGCYVCN